eukprot:CAMPEP_0118923942 /NCGR_PEP_ID=MMETSP1169-20130426/2279_1 /TAXON_ID=36882 /ORGANISM="Pyramimonas obovata, Strain CCMP722" /LENGTH=546 /DNA_ID=CAMNT_0006865005 /DNA_START=136 /DNA_END=1776 /DNA_ORIENTATION=-
MRTKVRVGHKRRFLFQAVAFVGSLLVGGLFTYSQNIHTRRAVAGVQPVEAGATSLAVEHHFGIGEEHFGSAGQRHLLSGGGGCECPAIADEDWAKNGIAFFVFIVLFVFLGLAVVCDEFFVASLEHISEKLKLTEDVAGATFMAMGSSAPELFTSMMALAQPDSSDSMGSGTIVGSAVFNVLMIVGATGIVGHGLVLDWKPLMRDGLFYGMCIILILIFFLDGKVKLYESIILLCGYGLYVTCMAFNERIFKALDHWAGKKIQPEDGPLGDKQKLSDLGAISLESPRGETSGNNEDGKEEVLQKGPAKEVEKKAAQENASEGEEEEVDLFKWPADGSPLDKFIWVFAIPYYWAFWLTIPDCRLEHRETWYLATFTMSVLWIGILVYFMVWATNIIGCVINFPPVPMSVLVLAAGTSIPDMFGSLAVAREGQGDMAVSNAIGSNVFDILLGLGLPWFIMILWRGEDISVEKGDLFMNIGFLFAVLVAYMTGVIWNNYKLTARMGTALCILYACFVIFTVVYYLLIDGCSGDSDSETTAPTMSTTATP